MIYINIHLCYLTYILYCMHYIFLAQNSKFSLFFELSTIISQCSKPVKTKNKSSLLLWNVKVKNDFCLLFDVPLETISLVWRPWWRAAMLRPMPSREESLSCRVTPAVTRYYGFCGLIRRAVPISSPSRTSMGYWWPILTRIIWH